MKSDIAKFFESEGDVGGPFKQGDKVMVLSSAKNGERGWKNGWNSTMNDVIGTVRIVTKDHSGAIETSGVQLDFGGFRFPPFVLKKV